MPAQDISAGTTHAVRTCLDCIQEVQPGIEENRFVSERHVNEVESGCQALAAVLGRESRKLHQIMAAANFQPVAASDVVPVRPCPRCLDGGLHLVGYLRGCIMALPILACDTCGEVILSR